LEILKEIKRHFYIYLVFIKNCLIKQMEYRTNFFLFIAIEVAYLFVKILYIYVVNKVGVDIYGLSPNAIFLFTGSFIIMTGIYMSLFFFNFSNIQNYIREGSLDLFITKPVSLQFIVTLRNVDLGSAIPNIVGGIIIVVIGWQRMGLAVNFRNIAGYVGYLISGTIITYSVMLLPQLLCFWVVKSQSLREVVDSMWDFNNMPMNIYNRWMRIGGVFIFPIFLVANFSPLYVLGKLNNIYIVWGIVAPVLFFFLTRILWKISIRNYTSASS